jgi:hypothetical protein
MVNKSISPSMIGWLSLKNVEEVRKERARSVADRWLNYRRTSFEDSQVEGSLTSSEIDRCIPTSSNSRGNNSDFSSNPGRPLPNQENTNELSSLRGKSRLECRAEMSENMNMRSNFLVPAAIWKAMKGAYRPGIRGAAAICALGLSAWYIYPFKLTNVFKFWQ